MPNDDGNREHDFGDLSGKPGGEGGTADRKLIGTSGQVPWANEIRGRVNLEFDRVRKAIENGANKFRGLDQAETAEVLAILDGYREAVFSQTQAEYFIAEWQNPADRLHRLLDADERWQVIRDARATRKIKAEVSAPVRYLGFEDAAGVRIYKFGRFPSRDDAEVFLVNIPVAMFLKHKISFQDGPAMCSAIMAAHGEPKNHWVTDEDSLEFIARRPVKSDRKPPRPKQALPAQ